MLNKYIKPHPWLIVEDEFNPERQLASESLFSLGNGRMGHRATFEEKYSGETMQGNFISGIYYPDPTKVGWWKNGYPNYFAKLINMPNWLGVQVNIGTVLEVDLAKGDVLEFSRTLDMQNGLLDRKFVLELKDGKRIKVHTQRFVSLARKEIGAIKYSITPLNFSGILNFSVNIDADVKNVSSNYNEDFFNELYKETVDNAVYLTIATRKTEFYVCTGSKFSVFKENISLNDLDCCPISSPKYVDQVFQVYCKQHETVTVFKYVAVLSSLDCPKESLLSTCKEKLNEAHNISYHSLLQQHMNAWHEKWRQCDVVIEGDIEAQQAIRFNLFQLLQSYTGEDPRLNIGPKGFTGEKYGGVTYWDTEAYCLPFYLQTSGADVAKNLLIYRHKHLENAIRNAEKLGFSNGAALYPMVTINGEECHNEWEITFEEIHRNGAIAYAIYNYINYTNDMEYLADYGLEVLIALSRFWQQRVNYSVAKKQYVILGVTGPNEYENNVNNNWYTNLMAQWTLRYTQEVIDIVKSKFSHKYESLVAKIRFDEFNEVAKWRVIAENMYFPYDDESKVFLQQEGYLDKEQQMASDLDPSERPINQHWSWDRILRSCFIKQADVLQGIYFFMENYSPDVIKRNFDFYEPRTVHESSLSACIHSVLASRIGYLDKAYEMYLRSTRLDLDDYNKEVHEGCHITSMGGAWLAIVYGFAGMHIKDDELHFNPVLPKQWNKYSFKIRFHGKTYEIIVDKDGHKVTKK